DIMNELTRISPGVVDAYNAQTGALRSMARASIEAMQAQLNLLRAQELQLEKESRTINPFTSFFKTRELYSVRADIRELEQLIGTASMERAIEEEMKKLAYYDA